MSNLNNVSKTISGLTSAEATEQIHRFGQNSLAKVEVNNIVLFLGKFWGLVPWMLEAAVIIEAILNRKIEAVVIATLLIFNAVLGFRQEDRAREALSLLRQKLRINSRVLRDGVWKEISAINLVPDDAIHLRIGDIMPADIKLHDGEIQVDQSQLTGESLSVTCKPGDVVYSGSAVVRGEGSGIVTATGKNTFFGKTAELVRTAEPPRHMEVLIGRITKYLGVLVLILSFFALFFMVYRGTPLFEMLPFALLLLMSSVPVALPTMFTMSATLGSKALAEKGVLVTRLSAIEDAASMDVLCLDKTGTITENVLSVHAVESFDSSNKDEVLLFASLASLESTQDAIDISIIKAVKENKIDNNQYTPLDFIPFDPSTKRSEVKINTKEETFKIMKGAPATIAKLAGVPWLSISDRVSKLSEDGSRVLAVAVEKENRLSIIGLIALGDSVRVDSVELIMDLRKRGIRVLLITGDGEATAQAIARKVGITGLVSPAGTLHEGFDIATALNYEVFANVMPQDKFFLVQALQKAGHVVGMTGDGVNDAPALRQADVGIAVARSTDVAKAAASLVLTKSGLSEIIAAIDNSRRIFQRMQNYAFATISRKLSSPTFIALGVIILNTFVINPLLMVLMKFVMDFATMSVATDNVVPSRKPDRWSVAPLIFKGLGVALVLVVFHFGVYFFSANVLHLPLVTIQTIIFVWLIIGSGQGVLYMARGPRFFWEKPYPSRWVLLATIFDIGVVVIMATQGWLMAPISWFIVASLLFLSLVFIFSANVIKIVANRLLA